MGSRSIVFKSVVLNSMGFKSIGFSVHGSTAIELNQSARKSLGSGPVGTRSNWSYSIGSSMAELEINKVQIHRVQIHRGQAHRVTNPSDPHLSGPSPCGSQSIASAIHGLHINRVHIPWVQIDGVPKIEREPNPSGLNLSGYTSIRPQSVAPQSNRNQSIEPTCTGVQVQAAEIYCIQFHRFAEPPGPNQWGPCTFHLNRPTNH